MIFYLSQVSSRNKCIKASDFTKENLQICATNAIYSCRTVTQGLLTIMILSANLNALIIINNSVTDVIKLYIIYNKILNKHVQCLVIYY